MLRSLADGLSPSDMSKERTAEEIGQLFADAIIALGEGMRDKPFVPFAEDVARVIIRRLPRAYGPRFMLPNVRHLFIRAIDIYDERNNGRETRNG